MPHDTTLIVTIAAAFVTAFALGFAAARLRLPPIVGYLLAGILIGPFTPGFVGDVGLAQQLAEIGVILLMFGVGLHFSIRDLLAVRRIAVPGAVAQILTAIAIGAAMAHAWGWSLPAGLTFGLALSVASTVVLLKALEQQRRLDTLEGRIAIGWLIVEDLAMVLALVMLPALAGSMGEAGGAGAEGAGRGVLVEVLLTLGKVSVFVAVTLLVGNRLVPWMLAQATRTGSREIFTLAVLAIALGIAVGSAKLFDVSFALGAFFAGVVLSESDLSQRAADDLLPLQDAFAVLFFVAVGMLFDPAVLVRDPLAVLGVILVIVIGKSIAAFLIVIAFGYPVATALTVAASLAQIGEFSFILVGFGIALELLPKEARDLILAGALVSIAINPFVFATIAALVRWLEARPRLLARIERTGASLAETRAELSASTRGHVVVVGYGRVGDTITPQLEQEQLPFVVIDRDRRRIDAVRALGRTAVLGDATTPGVLESAGIREAAVLLLATTDSYGARRVLEIARAANPSLHVIARAHGEAEASGLRGLGADVVVLGEQELARTMLWHAMRRLQVPADRAQRMADDVSDAAGPGDTLRH